MDLENLQPSAGATKKRKRIGRGKGSGTGGTSTRGHKGQKSRSGFSRRAGFEGGQMPLQRRIPKRGFTNIFRKDIAQVNVRDLERVFPAGSKAGPDEMREKGLLRHGKDGVKILGDGELTVALTITAHSFSAQAREKIEAAGGTCDQIPAKIRPLVKGSAKARAKAKAEAKAKAKGSPAS
jgi:large subunit ribosomal protein L15